MKHSRCFVSRRDGRISVVNSWFVLSRIEVCRVAKITLVRVLELSCLLPNFHDDSPKRQRAAAIVEEISARVRRNEVLRLLAIDPSTLTECSKTFHVSSGSISLNSNQMAYTRWRRGHKSRNLQATYSATWPSTNHSRDLSTQTQERV